MAVRVEDLTGQVDGERRAFDLADTFDPASLVVTLNGQVLRRGPGHDFVEATFTSFVMAVAPLVGDALLVRYDAIALVTGYGFDPTV